MDLTPEKLPCGCEVGTAVVDGVKTMYYKPCSETCKYYAYVIEESRKKGNEIGFRRD